MRVSILGTRGIPRKHGGFETFAEDLSLFLTSRNHKVTVYCQVSATEQGGEDEWRGVRRILIPSPNTPFGTIFFDWAAILHSFWEGGTILTLGYNTGLFNFVYRLRGLPNVMNMDGLEWKRKKWSRLQRAWLWFNELAGAKAATHLVADHPEIGQHLQRHTSSRKITVIPYGAHRVTSASMDAIRQFGLEPKCYYLVIARPEPENSVLEIVKAFSARIRESTLVVLGAYDGDHNEYHRQVKSAANSNVVFLGPIYERNIVESLRFHAKAYLHGHTVGGTNPSLVESLAVGNAIVAHDNQFNAWVAGESGRYFRGADDLRDILDSLESEPNQLFAMEAGSRKRHYQMFMQDNVLQAYERLLLRATHGEVLLSVEQPVYQSRVQVETVRGRTHG
ncbi:MAG TPA: DUF1972 domain-containing protein [Terracidiphilus sp.]|jgi:glycosyltransferase involved in cell wall biosynthesis|nr:DUF1972 domain-containing protein [Terracidiphilus sp.]